MKNKVQVRLGSFSKKNCQVPNKSLSSISLRIPNNGFFIMEGIVNFIDENCSFKIFFLKSNEFQFWDFLRVAKRSFDLLLAFHKVNQSIYEFIQ